MPKPLNKKAFKSWLKHLQKKHVFQSNSAGNCPIAQYLGGDTSVGTVLYYTYRSGRTTSRPLPAWAKAFIFTVDRIPTKPDELGHRYLTRDQVLGILG